MKGFSVKKIAAFHYILASIYVTLCTFSSASLQCELEQQYGTELEMVQRQGEREREGWRRERQQLESQREKEVLAKPSDPQMGSDVNCLLSPGGRDEVSAGGDTERDPEAVWRPLYHQTLSPHCPAGVGTPSKTAGATVSGTGLCQERSY